jgi:hypothetical protein
LPLTLAILPVLLVLLGDQPFALPLSMVREILPIDHERMQEVGRQGNVGCAWRDPAGDRPRASAGLAAGAAPEYGVLMQTAERSFILAVDNFAGRDDAVIKRSRRFPSARGCRGDDAVERSDRPDPGHEGTARRSDAHTERDVRGAPARALEFSPSREGTPCRGLRPPFFL